MDGFSRRLVGNASWGLASIWVEFVVGLATTTMAARALGAADYGRVALVTAAVGLVREFVDVRTWEGVTRYLATFLQEGRRGLALATIKVALVVESIAAIAGCALAVVTARLLAERLLEAPELRSLVALYALILLTSAFDALARAVLRVFNRFQDLAVQSVVQSLGSLVILGLLLAIERSVRAVLIAHLLWDVVEAALLGVLAVRQIRWHLWSARAEARLSGLGPHLAPLLKFMGHTALRATLKMNRHLDILALGYFQSPAAVGQYRVARRLATALEDLSNPFYFAIFPELARTWAVARTEFARIIRRTATKAAKVTLPVTLLVIAVAPALVGGLVGPGFEPSVTPLRLLMIGGGLTVATFWGTPAALGSGHPGIATAAVAFGVLADGALLLLLVPAHGASGAAVAAIGGAVAYGITIAVLLPPAMRRAA